MDRFLASENDREAFFRDAGIWDPRNRDHSKNENFVVSECLICLDKKVSERVTDEFQRSRK